MKTHRRPKQFDANALYIPWVGAGLVLVALIVPRVQGSAMLALTGVVAAVVTPLTLWKNTPTGRRPSLLIAPAALALIAGLLYLSVDHSVPAGDTLKDNLAAPTPSANSYEPPKKLSLEERITAWSTHVASTYESPYAPAKPSVQTPNDNILGWVNTMLQDPLTANGVVKDVSGPFYPDGGDYARVELGGSWANASGSDRYYHGDVWLAGASAPQQIWVRYQFHTAPAPVGGTWVIEQVTGPPAGLQP